MHDYFPWAFVFSAFPLLILSFERLIYDRKLIMYILILSYCMVNGVDFTFYCCLFLVLLFFTANFKSIKDFLVKGIYFAIGSILSAMCSFVYIFDISVGRSGSGYEADDSIFPTFHLFGSFFEELKQHMIFSYSTSSTPKDNSISLFFSVLGILLIVLFFVNKKIALSEKIICCFSSSKKEPNK